MWTLYILKCSDGSLYTGITTDLAKRLKRHNEGRATRYTRSRRPVTVVYQEPCHTEGIARSREAAIKNLSRNNKLDLIKSRPRK